MEAKKKVAKGPKSCLNCRKSKQRCDIPDRKAIRPSHLPQPKHLSCHRCTVLRLPCTIDIQLVEDGESPPHPNNRTSTLSSSTTTASSSSYDSKDLSPPFSKRRKSSTATTSHTTTTPQSTLDSRVHVFDPYFSGDGYGDNLRDSAGLSRGGSDQLNQSQHSSPIIDIADKLQSLRPFPYLFRLCSTQPNFLASPVSKGPQGQTLRSVIHKHANEIDWEEMNSHLQDYHFFLPFLESLRPAEQAYERDGLYIATRLYLAALRTDMVDLQIDLLLFLRPQTLSCVLRGPATIGEASALVCLALYEPLLLVNSSEQMELDGSGLLAAASTASKTLDLDRLPYIMQHFDFRSNQDPYGLLQECSLWLTIALTSIFNTLAGSFHQRSLLECTLEDLDRVENFCNSLLDASPHSIWNDQISRLLLLIFRYRSHRQFQDIIQSQFAILTTLPNSPYGPAQACLVEGLAKALTFAKKVLNKLKFIRHSLAKPGPAGDMCVDYLEFETAHLHMFCIINFTEACMIRIGTNYGRPIDLSTMVAKIVTDEEAAGFASAVVGITKSDMSKRLVSLFANFASRWCEPVGQIQSSSSIPSSPSLALPPAHLSSILLANVKTMADYVGGFIQLGNYPKDCLDDCGAGNTVCLCRCQADDLQRFATYQSKELFHAKGHRDLFRLTSDIALRTSKTIHDWTANSKGLRLNHQQPLHQQLNRSNLNPHSTVDSAPKLLSDGQRLSSLLTPGRQQGGQDAASLEAMQLMRADGQNFERLLEDILSTPIFFN